MKKKIKFNYTQLLVAEEFIEIKKDYLIKQLKVGEKMKKNSMSEFAFELKENGKVKNFYHLSLLTEEEMKIIAFENEIIIKKIANKNN